MAGEDDTASVQAVVNAGAAAAIVTAMRAHPEDDQIQGFGCTGLGHMAGMALCSYGLSSWEVVMATWAETKDAQTTAAARELREECRAAVVEAGAIPAIVAAMRRCVPRDDQGIIYLWPI